MISVPRSGPRAGGGHDRPRADQHRAVLGQHQAEDVPVPGVARIQVGVAARRIGVDQEVVVGHEPLVRQVGELERRAALEVEGRAPHDAAVWVADVDQVDVAVAERLQVEVRAHVLLEGLGREAVGVVPGGPVAAAHVEVLGLALDRALHALEVLARLLALEGREVGRDRQALDDVVQGRVADHHGGDRHDDLRAQGVAAQEHRRVRDQAALDSCSAPETTGAAGASAPVRSGAVARLISWQNSCSSSPWRSVTSFGRSPPRSWLKKTSKR